MLWGRIHFLTIAEIIILLLVGAVVALLEQKGLSNHLFRPYAHVWRLNTESLVCNSGCTHCEGITRICLSWWSGHFVTVVDFWLTLSERKREKERERENLSVRLPFVPKLTFWHSFRWWTNKQISRNLCLVEKPAGGDYVSQYWIKITQSPDPHRVSLIQPNG